MKKTMKNATESTAVDAKYEHQDAIPARKGRAGTEAHPAYRAGYWL